MLFPELHAALHGLHALRGCCLTLVAAARAAMWAHLPGRKKVHFTFPDETELVEEYDARTGGLLCTFNAVVVAALSVCVRVCAAADGCARAHAAARVVSVLDSC